MLNKDALLADLEVNHGIRLMHTVPRAEDLDYTGDNEALPPSKGLHALEVGAGGYVLLVSST